MGKETSKTIKFVCSRCFGDFIFSFLRAKNEIYKKRANNVRQTKYKLIIVNKIVRDGQ